MTTLERSAVPRPEREERHATALDQVATHHQSAAANQALQDDQLAERVGEQPHTA